MKENIICELKEKNICDFSFIRLAGFSLDVALGDIWGNAEKIIRIAEKAKALGIERVAFDRSGFQYHGRVKALAEAARENGLNF